MANRRTIKMNVGLFLMDTKLNCSDTMSDLKKKLLSYVLRIIIKLTIKTQVKNDPSITLADPNIK